MNPHDIHTEVSIHYRRFGNPLVEVRVFEEEAGGKPHPVPGGFVSEVQYIPELMKALRWALKTAREEGILHDRVNRSSSSEGADRG
jgi:hypothetical protein